MNPRQTRLWRDLDKLQELASRSPFIAIERTQGRPPHDYWLQLTCKGVERVTAKGFPVYSESHQLHIHLGEEYPRKPPEFSMCTPMYHPNIGGSGLVCIGDEGDHGFAPSMGLDDLVVRIVQIIRYENWNPSSILNTPAKTWATENDKLFPLDTRQIVGPLVEATILDEIQILDQSRAVDELDIVIIA